MEEEQTTPWRLDSYLEFAFDSLTGSEYWTPIPCAYNVATDEKLTLAELIPIEPRRGYSPRQWGRGIGALWADH